MTQPRLLARLWVVLLAGGIGVAGLTACDSTPDSWGPTTTTESAPRYDDAVAQLHTWLGEIDDIDPNLRSDQRVARYLLPDGSPKTFEQIAAGDGPQNFPQFKDDMSAAIDGAAAATHDRLKTAVGTNAELGSDPRLSTYFDAGILDPLAAIKNPQGGRQDWVDGLRNLVTFMKAVRATLG